jgi:uncharacterized MAPEG superfamily protein
VFALLAKLPGSKINTIGIVYTLARFAYAVAYVLTEKRKYSWVRSLCWWIGNGACFWAILQTRRDVEALYLR